MSNIITYDNLIKDLKPEQIRYVMLKTSTSLSQRDIAKQLDVHYNTITNWNKNPQVQQLITYEMEQLKNDNSLKIQQLMNSMLKQAMTILNDKATTSITKAQIIGQLFTSVGKYAGLEPAKNINKNINVKKSYEQLISGTDVEFEEVEGDE